MTAAAGFLGYLTYRFFFAKKQRGSGDSSEESSDPESASLVNKARKGQKSGRGASGGVRSLLLKTQKSGNQASAGLSEEEKIDTVGGRRSGMNGGDGDSGRGRDRRRNSKQGINRDGMPNASDVSEEDFAGPLTGEAANGMESSGRKIKLPVMYFDSNDEMFFEDEASLEFMEESSCTEVVAGQRPPGEISQGNRMLYKKLMKAGDEERRRIREQLNRQKKRQI